MSVASGHLSREFYNLVKEIGEARSKQEEDRIIVNEIAVLKQRLSEPVKSAKKVKELLVRAVYVEMLGHDASFAHIHAVKLAHEKNPLCKRMGYAACNVCLHKDHELMLLLINTIQKDLGSTSHLEASAALTSVCRLVNDEMIPAVAPLVIKLLDHRDEVVKRKAVMACQRLYQLSPESIPNIMEKTRTALRDRAPCVWGASLYLLHDIVRNRKRGVQPHSSQSTSLTSSSVSHSNSVGLAACKHFVPGLVCMLKQTLEHKLDRDYEYHRIPAPWIQIKLLSVLADLGANDQAASEEMYRVIQDCMSRVETSLSDSRSVNVGYALMYECIKTATVIYPQPQLLQAAAASIARFISADNHNLKYVGVTGLTAIVQLNPKFALDHQLAVVDCLEDEDETLKRKTLDLLFAMTNPQNLAFVVEKLLFHLRLATDPHWRRELAMRVTQLADRYSPSAHWYITTVNSVLELAGKLIATTDNTEAAYNIINLVADGAEAVEVEADEGGDGGDKKGGGGGDEFRRFAVQTYMKLLDRVHTLPDILVQVVAWVIGEYGHLVTPEGNAKLHSLQSNLRGSVDDDDDDRNDLTLGDIIEMLCDCIDRSFADPTTCGWILSAIMKLSATHLTLSPPSPSSPLLLPAVYDVLYRYQYSQSAELAQRCSEYLTLFGQRTDANEVSEVSEVSKGDADDFAIWGTKNWEREGVVSVIKEVLPFDMSTEEIEFDFDPLHKHASTNNPLDAPYIPPSRRPTHTSEMGSLTRPPVDGLQHSSSRDGVGAHSKPSTSTGLRYEYPEPPKVVQPVARLPPGTQGDVSGGGDHVGVGRDSERLRGCQTATATQLRVEGPQVWGPQGYNKTNPTTAAHSHTQAPHNTNQRLAVESHGSSHLEAQIPPTIRQVVEGSAEAHKWQGGTSQGVSQPAPPQPRELSKRERTAAMLFTGTVGGTNVAQSNTQPSRPQSTSRPSSPIPSPATSAVSGLGLGGFSPASSTCKESSGPANMDLLDLESGAGDGGGEVTKVSEVGEQSGGGGGVLSVDDTLLGDILTCEGAGISPLMPTDKGSAATRPSGGELLLDRADEVGASRLSETPRGGVVDGGGGELNVNKVSFSPLMMTTAEVGAKWSSASMELRSRVSVPPTALNLNTVHQLMQRLKTCLNAHVVEIIGDEGIAAANVRLPSGPQELLFLHIKLSQTPTPNVDIIARSSLPSGAEAAISTLTVKLVLPS
eukprot:GHVN01103892.1.p1 GENE.GHVN01103892.1~~GHVN01103892.1.p1  ORF type:complete len:1215 (+),score=297.72 GHVN01103892.1:326-3970(+)